MTDLDNRDLAAGALNMPNLSELKSHKFLINGLKMISGMGPKDPVVKALTLNFIRLTDHLIFEYENSRKAFVEFRTYGQHGHFLPAYRAICHFETAVTTMHRTIRLAQRIRKWPHEPKVPVPDKSAVLHGSVEKQVGDVRNAIEHVYDEVREGDRKDVAAFGRLQADGFECEGLKLIYSDFAGWIRQLDKIAEAMLD